MKGVAEARRAYRAQAWARAYELFAAAERLDADELDEYAVSAMLLGRMDEYYAIRERAYEQLLAERDLLGAASAALWSGLQRMVSGDEAVGSGWLGRAARLTEEDGTDSVPAAALRMSQAFQTDDAEQAVAISGEAVAAGRRLGSRDLVALALHQQGRFLIQAGQTTQGLAKLDEAMVELASGSLSPMVTGIVYCGAIAGCWIVYELRRAEEWTAAMGRWCDAQPDLGNFTGECKVRRAELKQLRGAWADARQDLAGVSTSDVDLWAAGCAAYVRGDIDRLQGRCDDADAHFVEAGRLGYDPQPGLALLRLQQGSVQAATAMIRRCVSESQDDAKRVEVLFAATEILLAAGDLEAAAAAANSLAELAEKCRTTIVLALADQATAMVRLAQEPDTALTPARAALRRWVELRAPYQEARTRLLIAEACHALGDNESADRETATARDTLERLGASTEPRRPDGQLTPREIEVLRLVATGATNRAIAAQLVLSERTVDRHVSNIFMKLGVSSRSAATAYGFEHRLV
ncbi:helix-turn-helix transcriptional regulator [Kribbella turkmenica]|uniref:Helix-turn-helix transcriptional regulator n=1 Tax=Kribbella turkmenica TaxID=2530375 RepID=A0A4R4WV77_9ACTN|nr:helix-turn-helix transcriptional regulator [Kribbella turkmenica]TDD21545.1 helix-turn-helix transcriptional regulator [Kribbella turkmenica]